MRYLKSMAVLCGAFAFAANAEFTITSSVLDFGDDSGIYYNGPLPSDPMSSWGNMGHYDWSGTNVEYVSFDASGGDYYSVNDWGDPWYSEYWEEMSYAYIDMTMTFTTTEEISLSGFGDLGFKLTDINGTSDAAALSSIENGLVLAAGTYTLQVTDFGFGTTDSWSNNYYEDTPEGPYWDYSWGDSYYYGGGFEFGAVPAPGAIALLALAGIQRRRRK